MATVAEVVNTLVELGFVRDDDEKAKLMGMTLPQLMEDYILPCCVCLPRSGVRYPRIDGSFMKLMAAYGRNFLVADYELGGVLLELAMQRITRHPDLPAIDYKGNLPEPYKAYAASAINPNGINGCPDEPGLWGTGEVEFLMAALPTCLALNDAKYSAHAATILFQLLTMLKSSGRDGISWLDDKRYCAYTSEELFNRAAEISASCGLNRLMTDRCVASGNWRVGLAFFANPSFNGVDGAYLLSQIDFDQERYFTGLKRFVLKLTGKYNKLTKKKIVEEIHRAR